MRDCAASRSSLEEDTRGQWVWIPSYTLSGNDRLFPLRFLLLFLLSLRIFFLFFSPSVLLFVFLLLISSAFLGLIFLLPLPSPPP